MTSVPGRRPQDVHGIRAGQTKEDSMSFQAYLDAVEEKTGLTPREIVARAHENGFGAETKSGVIVDWLKQEYGLGRGHAMAMVHVVKNGAEISDKHVGSSGTHRDPSTTLWLDGKVTRPGVGPA
jgi:hypothetical protein